MVFFIETIVVNVGRTDLSLGHYPLSMTNLGGSNFAFREIHTEDQNVFTCTDYAIAL